MKCFSSCHLYRRTSGQRITRPVWESHNYHRAICDVNNNTNVRRSCRKRYTHYVIGQLIQIALTLYDVKVDVRVVDEQQEEDGCHVTLRLDFVNKKTGSISLEGRCPLPIVTRQRLPPVSGITLLTVKKSLFVRLKKWQHCDLSQNRSLYLKQQTRSSGPHY